jgi:hypothetical protein
MIPKIASPTLHQSTGPDQRAWSDASESGNIENVSTEFGLREQQVAGAAGTGTHIEPIVRALGACLR